MMSGARGNGFIPVIRPRTDLGVELNRAPRVLGSYTTASTGASTGIRVDCSKEGFVEFGGAVFGNWEFAYAENAKQFFPIRPGDIFPGPSSGAILLRETASGVGTGTVIMLDWGYEAGFVRALSGRASVVSLTSAGKYATPTGETMQAPVTAGTVSGTGLIYTPTAGTVQSLLLSPDLPSGTANTDTIYIARSAAGATVNAFPLAPGGSVMVYGTDPVYFYSPTAAQKISGIDYTA